MGRVISSRATSPIGITAVVPLYRVERYLPDLLDSLSHQEPGAYRLEVIFVDDGSPDRSGELAAQWLHDSGTAGRVIRQEQSGVSAARNAGLDAATHEWITFPDSDDYLSEAYFAEVARFAQHGGRRATVLSTRLLRLKEPARSPRNVHALGFRFIAGNRVVDMDRHPDFFQLNVASAFFRTAELRRSGVRFRTGLHASEDALFVAEFLLGQPRRRLGLVAEAQYVYRKREAADSAVDRYRQEPSTYIDRFRIGYAPLMQQAADAGGVPRWLQSMFLYECQWLLPPQLTDEGYADVLDDAGRQATLDALTTCARAVDDDVLYRYDATALSLESRLLLAALAGRDLPSWTPAVRDTDGTVHTHTDGPGSVSVGASASGRERPPRIEYPDYFGQRVLARVAAVVPAGTRRLLVDGSRRQVSVLRRYETVAERADRIRRRHARVRGIALPSREGEVRVWKSVVGPGGSAVRRMKRLAAILRRGSRRRKALRRSA